MEAWKNISRQIQTLWTQLGVPQRIMVGAVLLLIVAAAVGVSIVGGQSDLRLLYGRLDPAEAGRITTLLDEQKVAYKIAGGGSSIMVPSDKVYGLRLQLAAKGLPKADGTGFEIFDKPAFGMSDFVQRANYTRALQGELSRTLSQMDGVESARLMIVLPENRLVIDAQRKATASVFLNVRMPGAVGPAAVNAIRFLVSNSVEGLHPRDISIVDNYGTMLSEPEDEASFASQAANHLNQRKNIERYLSEKLRTMFETILGPGQAVVRVAAEVSQDAITRTSEYYDPAGTVPNKITRKEEATDSINPTPGGVAGVVVNASTNLNPNATVGSRLTKRDSTEDYLVSRVQTNVVQGVGGLRRVSAAIFVNLRYEGTANARHAVSRSPDELRKLQVAAEKALGSSLVSGGQNEVVVEEIPFNEEPQQAQVARSDADRLWERGLELGRVGALVLSGILILFFLARMLRRGSEELLASGVPLGQMLQGQNLVAMGAGGTLVAGMTAPGTPGGSTGSNSAAEADDDDASELVQEEKKKMVMDFGLSKQRPERVTIEVLKDLIRDNPQKMTQAARVWLTNKGEEKKD